MEYRRLYHSVRLFLCRTTRKRAQYLKKHDLLGSIGDNCRWGPWILPLYPKLIKLHNNVVIHKTALLIPHDVLNLLLENAYPETDFGHFEKIGCIEIMDNVYVSANVQILADVRINKNCIISAGSVVSSDIPENSIASGVPAKPVGRFDMFVALRKITKNQRVMFKNQILPDEFAKAEWIKFEQRHNSI